MSEHDQFGDIYTRLVELVTTGAARRNLPRPPLRDPAVAHASVLDVPRGALLAIEDDESFVISCFLVILETAPSVGETRAKVRRLRAGAETREQILDQVLGSEAFARGGRRVNFT